MVILSRMHLLSLVIGGCALLNFWVTVRGDGCSNRVTFGLPEVNMCEQGSLTLGHVVISVTSESMGNNTGCVCVIRSRTPGLESSTLFISKANDSGVTRCTESQIQINPFSDFTGSLIQNFTCTSPLDASSYTGRTTSDVMITLTRADTSVGVSYCLLAQPDRWQENDVELSCQSGLTPPPKPPTSSSTASTSTAYPSTVVTPTPLKTTTPPSALPTSSVSTSTSSSSPTLRSSSSQSAMTSSTSPQSSTVPDGDSSSAGSASTVPTDSLASERQDFPIEAVAGIVLGAIALFCLTVIIVVYIRHKGKPASKPETGADNSAYTSLSDVARVNPRADSNYAVIQSERSSSQPGGNDVTSPTNVYETVDADGSVTRDSNYVNNSTVEKGTYYNV